jgi:hypothetical protein
MIEAPISIEDIFEGDILIVGEDAVIRDCVFEKGEHYLVYAGPRNSYLYVLVDSEDGEWEIAYVLHTEPLEYFSQLLAPGDEHWEMIRPYMGPDALPVISSRN